jgi:hypothetical protein
MSDLPPALPGNAGRADYPRMVYHKSGGTRIVHTPSEENTLRLQGWGQQPHEVHRRPSVNAMPIAGGNDPVGLMIRDTLERVLDERGLTKDAIAKLTGATNG